MKRLLLVLVALVASSSSGSAQLAPVKATAYRWKELRAIELPGRAERLIVSGSTLDLDSLDVRAVTLAPGGAAASDGSHETTELFLMVKEGAIWLTIGGTSQSLGAGSVAVALPGDPVAVANKGSVPASYYLFTYRSKAPVDLERGRRAGGSFMVSWSDLTERPTASGTRRDVFNRPTAMFKRFEGHVSSVGEGLRNHATHSHRADEVMLLTKGEVEMLIGDAHPKASASDIVFLGSQIPHSLANIGKGPTQYLVIQGE